MIPQFKTENALESPDDFYEALIGAHKDLSREQSEALNARLILLLANQIGSQPVLMQAIAAARATLDDEAAMPDHQNPGAV